MKGPNSSPEVEALLRSAEERIFEAIRARNLAGLEAELSEDFVHSPLGSAEMDRGAFIASVRDMPYRILEIRGENLRVRVFGDTAILSGIQRARVALPDGAAVNAATGFVDVFVRTQGQWRLRHAVSAELPGES